MFWEGFRDVGWMLETLTLYLSTVNRSWPTNTMWTEDENFLGHRRPRGHNSTQISSDHHISLIVQLFLKTFFASFTFVLLAICGLKYVGWRYLNVGVCNIEFIWTKVTKTTQVHWAVSLKCRKRLFCSILRTFLQKSSYFSILAWQIGHFRHIFIICCTDIWWSSNQESVLMLWNWNHCQCEENSSFTLMTGRRWQQSHDPHSLDSPSRITSDCWNIKNQVLCFGFILLVLLWTGIPNISCCNIFWAHKKKCFVLIWLEPIWLWEPLQRVRFGKPCTHGQAVCGWAAFCASP